MSLFSVENLSIGVENKIILKNINLALETGKIAFLLGRNGEGKSTLAQAIMGNPGYNVLSGCVLLDGHNQSILDLKPEERAKLGIFVSFQHPPEIEGVSLMNFLHSIYVERFSNEDPLARSTFKFRKHVLSLLERVSLPSEFLDRSLNVGFSGGEKKRCEMLQLMLLKPRIAILDEIDSGLDVHAMSILQSVVQELVEQGSSVLYISHNVDFVRKYAESTVLVLQNGVIEYSGKSEAIDQFIEKKSE